MCANELLQLKERGISTKCIFFWEGGGGGGG